MANRSKDAPVWEQETSLISIAVSIKPQNALFLFLLVSASFVGLVSIVVLYLLVPLIIVLSSLHDWWAQLLGAGCILIFIEGLIGMTLLKIAQVAPAPKTISSPISRLPIDCEKTIYLPLMPQESFSKLLPETELPTQLLPQNKGQSVVYKLASLSSEKRDLLPTLKQPAFSIQEDGDVNQSSNRQHSPLEKHSNHPS